MYRVIGLHIRIYITVCMVAIMSCLAITAKAGQFDYDAAMEKATTEINGKKYIGAFNTIKEIGRNAFQNNNQYGKYIFYTATANLYHEQGDFVKAETQYRLAIGIAENDLPDIDASGTYLDMARCLDKLTRRSEGVELLTKALERVKTEESRALLRVELGKMLFWEKRYGDFRTYFKQAVPYFNKEISSDNSAYLKVLMALINGDSDKAEKTAMDISNLDTRLAALREVYVSTGDYHKAYPIFVKRACQMESTGQDESMAYHIAEMDADIINSRLNVARLKLEYDMAQQKLKMSKGQETLNLSKHENIKIKLANDSQLIAKMRADSLVKSEEAEKREAQTEMYKTMGKRHRITMYFAIAIFLFVIAYGLLVWKSNRYVIRNLKEKQQLLSEALDKAQETERMKTAFVDNLGYEVKTPMNKIVGLVENALSHINKMSEEKKKDIEKEISYTADGLTAMLNNVLKNSLAESGKKTAKTIVVVLVLCTSLLPKTTSAQFVKNKIAPDLYPLYIQAQNNRDLPKGLEQANQLYRIGNERGDKYAMCVAINVMLQHYVINNNTEQIATTAKRLKTAALECGDKQMYYLAFSNEINGYLNNGQSLTAQRLASEQLRACLKNNDTYGQYVAMKTLGDVQRVRRYYKSAINMYLDTYAVLLKNNIEADPTSMLINLCKLLRQQGDYSDAAHYLNEAERHHKVLRSLYRINIEKARLAFETNDKPTFTQHMEELRKMKAENGFRYPYEEKLLNIMEMLFDGKRDKAMDKAKEELTDEGLLRIAELDCVHNGEWKEACETFQQEVVMHRNKMKQVYEDDRKEMSDIAGNNKLEAKNMQMKIASANMAIDELRQHNELNKFIQAKNQLIIDNNELVIKRLKAEQKLTDAVESRKQAVLEMQWETTVLHRRIARLTLLFALIMAAAIMSYLWHSHKSKKQLRAKNRELDAAIQKAQESEKLKSTFIQNMSHEIRTPLNAIVGFSKLILDEGNDLDEKEKENFVNIIRRNEELLTQLVDDVMSLHELHNKDYKMTYSNFNANKICLTSIETVKHRTKPGVPIYFNTDVDKNFEIYTDGMRVAQVIINFLTNAIKYTEEGMITVDCSLEKRHGYLTISVTDTGCGIPKDKQTEIFERFAKLDSFHQGTGLGLNICHVISQRLGGKVGIDPEYDKGARFYLMIPLK